jgi:precorrin-2 dehydrogenase/sirohydrochlorin ferrochelatase
VNEAFAAAAREAGVLRNRADRAGSEDAGSVVVPATVRDDPVVVSVSTSGRSPALSAQLRERLAAEIEGAGAMADLSGDVRADLQARGVAPAVRRAAVRAVVSDAGVWKALRTGTTNARQVASTVVDAVVDEQGSP